jgi:WD40 repeat protein
MRLIHLAMVPVILLVPGAEAGPTSVPAERKGTPTDPLPAGAVAQFGSPRFQHSDVYRPAAFSPNGKLLAIGGTNGSIHVWEVATGVLVRTHRTHGPVRDLRWQPDGKIAVLTSFGQDVFLMQQFDNGAAPANAEEEKRIDEAAVRRDRRAAEGKGRPGRLDHCFLSADGRQAVAVWFGDNKRPKWAAIYRFASAATSDAPGAEREVTLPIGSGVWLSGDGKTLLAHAQALEDRPARLCAFDLRGPRGKDGPTWEFPVPGWRDGWPSCFSHDGKRVVLLFWSGRVELWDGPSGKRLRELPELPWYYLNHTSEARGIDLTADGKRLVLIRRGTNGEVGGRVVDVTTGADVCRLAPQALPRAVGGACFSPDGKRAASVHGGVVAVWNAETGANACPLPGHRGEVNSFAVLPGGKRVVTAGEDLSVRMWDLATGKEVWRTPLPQLVTVKFVSPEGSVVVQERKWRWRDGVALCLDGGTGRARPWPGKLADAGDEDFLACSADGKVLTRNTKHQEFRVWSWPAGELRTTAPLLAPRSFDPAGCWEAHFTPDGKRFVAIVAYSDPAEQQTIRRVPDHPFIEVWEAATGKRLTRTDLSSAASPLLIPHRSGMYFWGKDDEVRDAVADLPLLKVRVPSSDPEWTWGLAHTTEAALSPDERTLALWVGFNQQRLCLFETRTGRFRGKLPVPGQSVRGVGFLPDGRLVSVGTTMTIWSIGLQPVPARAGERLTERELTGEWERLRDPDPAQSWPAMAKLAGAPEEAVAFLHKQVRAVPKLSEETLDRILRNLDAESFRDRAAAEAELDGLGLSAVPWAKAQVAKVESLEGKRRLQRFLARHEPADLPADVLRSLRSVEILETVATRAGRRLLRELVGGEPTARLTQEAEAALRRIGER